MLSKILVDVPRGTLGKSQLHQSFTYFLRVYITSSVAEWCLEARVCLTLQALKR